MIRKIIQIDEDKCNGCGLCARACHEGAIGMVEGKARLLREDYCDGLGDCLPACPTGAISFVVREAPAYDAAAVAEAQAKRPAGGCPGAAAAAIRRPQTQEKAPAVPGQLSQWPVQIKLVPTQAPWFEGADLLIAADCTAFAYGNFHNDFMRGKVTTIGCPKLDAVDYSEKLTQIFTCNNIRSVTVTRMSVPCCGGLLLAVKNSIARSGKDIPLHTVIIRPDGQILG